MIYLAAGAMVLFIVCALYIAWDILAPVREASRRNERE